MQIRWVIEEDREAECWWLSIVLTIRERLSTTQRRILSTKSVAGWSELELRQFALHLNEREEMASNQINTINYMETLHGFLDHTLKFAKATSLVTQMERRELEAWKSWHTPIHPLDAYPNRDATKLGGSDA